MSTITLQASCLSESRLYSGPSESRSISSVINLYPLNNYSVRYNNYEDPPRMSDYIQSLKLRQDYETYGMIRTVLGVLLDGTDYAFFYRPGGKLRCDEDEMAGIRRLMTQIVGFEDSADTSFKIHHIIANWWRPNFEAPVYPYIPAHITKPKEVIKVFIVELPKRISFTIAKNNTLVAAPLFEIYDNVDDYGPIIANLPHVLSRLTFVFKFVLFNLIISTTPEVGFHNDSFGTSKK
uniref:Cleavage and polyadenylation specificity factor subunit 5 n=1 Tax=Setaria digitata TaxID=48799 RepID=A0A915PQ07_9BILA